jgi:DNA repair photolyase
MSNKNNWFSAERIGHGTKEWADYNINIGKGCSHGCLYCYASDMALRFGRIKDREEWLNEVIVYKNVTKGYRLRKGVIMMPTAHDVTGNYLPHVVSVLKKILAAGNQVLIVSKPHYDCIKEICRELSEYKAQIVFRFTIGTLDPVVSRFWEPGAPLPEGRLESLAYARSQGFETSVSMEPMLGGTDDAIRTFHGVEGHVSDKIWVGKMSLPRRRVDISRPDLLKAVEEIELLQSDEEIKRLYGHLNSHPKIAWKDSIKKVMVKKWAS